VKCWAGTVVAGWDRAAIYHEGTKGTKDTKPPRTKAGDEIGGDWGWCTRVGGGDHRPWGSHRGKTAVADPRKRATISLAALTGFLPREATFLLPESFSRLKETGSLAEKSSRARTKPAHSRQNQLSRHEYQYGFRKIIGPRRSFRVPGLESTFLAIRRSRWRSSQLVRGEIVCLVERTSALAAKPGPTLGNPLPSSRDRGLHRSDGTPGDFTSSPIHFAGVLGQKFARDAIHRPPLQALSAR